MSTIVTSGGAGPGESPWEDLLIAVAENGDREAFSRLFRHFAPRIKTFMIRLGVSDAAAEELAQEAMMAVWRKAPSFDRTRAGAGTWIFTIARNLRIDLLRREKRPEIDPNDPMLVRDPEPAVDEAMDVVQREAGVRRALADLPPEQAEVVSLSFYEDTPHAEIAARLMIPLGTVKSRLRLAMKRIRAQLGDLT